jgi:hypothetical protein
MYLIYNSDDDEEGVSGELEDPESLDAPLEWLPEAPNPRTELFESIVESQLAPGYGRAVVQAAAKAVDNSEELRKRPTKRNLYINELVETCLAEEEYFGEGDEQYRDYEHCADGEVTSIEEKARSFDPEEEEEGEQEAELDDEEKEQRVDAFMAERERLTDPEDLRLHREARAEEDRERAKRDNWWER